MIKLKEAVIVEGKYDKIKLSAIIDAVIIETDGFGIFGDKEKLDLIKKLAVQKGLLILTDSDRAGFKIRDYLSGSVDKSLIKHAYIPDVFGKEKRKSAFSKEGKLGVEGTDKELLLKSLKAAGITTEITENSENKRLITKTDFYEDGLCGKPSSANLRLKLIEYYGLPARLSANRLLQVLNIITTFEEYKTAVRQLTIDN